MPLSTAPARWAFLITVLFTLIGFKCSVLLNQSVCAIQQLGLISTSPLSFLPLYSFSPLVHSDSLFFCSVYSADSYKSIQSIVAGESVPPLRSTETHLDNTETPVATQSQKKKFDPFTHRFFSSFFFIQLSCTCWAG